MNEKHLDDENTNAETTTPNRSDLTLSQNRTAEAPAVTTADPSEPSEPLPETAALSANCGTALDPALGTVALPATSGTNLDPDPSENCSTASEELRNLYNELNALKASVAKQDERLCGMMKDYSEFHELYPDVSVRSLPDEVWHRVEQDKIPLAAAYALTERRQWCHEQLASESNERNRARSAGRILPLGEDDYTPEEVRSMPPKEVRRHLSKIMQSMKKWK